jgi:dipicolinic acid synthetase, B subunit
MNIGFCITGSFCTFKRILPIIKDLVSKGNAVFPIFSFSTASLDTRFYKAADFHRDVKEITGNEPVATLAAAEPFGPSNMLDIIIVAPCTGNTLAKLNNAITDTPVLMAAKAHLRNNKPVLIGVSTNDGLSANAKNIGELLNKKNIYFVPFSQDNPIEKTSSLVAHFELTEEAAVSAVKGVQLQPVLRGK